MGKFKKEDLSKVKKDLEEVGFLIDKQGNTENIHIPLSRYGESRNMLGRNAPYGDYVGRIYETIGIGEYMFFDPINKSRFYPESRRTVYQNGFDEFIEIMAKYSVGDVDPKFW